MHAEAGHAEPGLGPELSANRASVPRPAVKAANDLGPAPRHEPCFLWGMRRLVASGPEPAARLGLDLPSRTPPFRVSPWRPSHLRGTGAASRPVLGQRSEEIGERVRKAATHFQGRGSGGKVMWVEPDSGSGRVMGGPQTGCSPVALELVRQVVSSLHLPKIFRKKP